MREVTDMEGIGALAAAFDMWRAEREGTDGLRRRQHDRLVALVSHARVHSPLFRRLYSGVELGDVELTELPVTRKPELMAEFDDWLTDRRVTRADVEAFVADPSLAGVPFLGEYFVCTTSGTTGRPGIFLADEETLKVVLASNAVGALRQLPRARWGRMLRHRMRQALVVGSGGHFAGVATLLRNQRLKQRRTKRVHLVPVEQPLKDLVAQVNDIDPASVEGYPSAVRQLAGEQLAGRLHIEPGLIGMAGETISAQERQEIGKVFGAPVLEGYAASECLLVAFSCTHEWMHYRSDWMILEPVDEDYLPVPDGARSHTVLLTDLSNRLQPVIRYDLGDSVLVRPDPCPCGSPLPAIRVIGRTNDVLRFPSSSGEVEVLPLAITSRLDGVTGLERFQLVQEDSDRLVARISCVHVADVESVRGSVRERLETYLAANGLGGVRLTVEELPPDVLGLSGKFRQVIGMTRVPVA